MRGHTSATSLTHAFGDGSSVTVLMLFLVLSWVFVWFIFLHLSPLLLSLKEITYYFEEVPGDLSRLSTKKLR